MAANVESLIRIRAETHISPFPGKTQEHTFDFTREPIFLSSHGIYTFFSTIGCKVRIQLWGAGGGGSSYSTPSPGSAGGYTEAIVSLVKDEWYSLLIGEGGAAGGHGV